MSKAALAVESKAKSIYKLRPRHSWVLVRKEVEGERLTNEGVILPERQQARSFRGTVVAFGDKVSGLALGDLVIFTAFPMEIEDIEELTGDKNLLLVRDEEVFSCADLDASCT